MKIIACILAFVAFVQSERNWTQARPVDVDSFLRGKLAIPYTNNSKIVGGNGTKPHSFPFLVGLVMNNQSFCGGSLISPEWILTAAHCIVGSSEKKIMVILGAHNVRKNESSQVIRTPLLATVHNQYDPEKALNDIGLVKLRSPVQLNENIQTVLLPRLSDVKVSFECCNATVSGWGKDADNSSVISPVLRSVNVKVIDNQICKIMFLLKVITDTNICTSGRGGTGACNGDSGGPLTVGKGNTLKQIGIVSIGSSSGCEIGWPSVYTRVTAYLEWISAFTGIKIRP